MKADFLEIFNCPDEHLPDMIKTLVASAWYMNRMYFLKKSYFSVYEYAIIKTIDRNLFS